jgi:hypothetical protein
MPLHLRFAALAVYGFPLQVPQLSPSTTPPLSSSSPFLLTCISLLKLSFLFSLLELSSLFSLLKLSSLLAVKAETSLIKLSAALMTPIFVWYAV